MRKDVDALMSEHLTARKSAIYDLDTQRGVSTRPASRFLMPGSGASAPVTLTRGPNELEPRISVVIAAFNYARYLGAALDSVLSQTGDLDVSSWTTRRPMIRPGSSPLMAAGSP